MQEKYVPSKSLKLLPILGLPSLPSLPRPGLLPASSAVFRGLNGPGLFPPIPTSTLLRSVTGAVELALESLVCDTSVFFPCIAVRLVVILCGSPRSVAEGSWCGCGSLDEDDGLAKGRNAGSSSSSSALDLLSASFCEWNFGRRTNRDCTGELDDDEEALADGEERGSGCGDRWGEIVEGGCLGDGLCRWAFAGRGEVWLCNREVVVVFADVVREIAGAPLAVVGVLDSAFGMGESLRVDRDEGTRPPPEPVRLMDSPPVSDMLPGTGDGAADFATLTLRI